MGTGSAIVNVMPGIVDRRSGLTPGALEAIASRLPAGFPKYIWNRQASFYRDYWAWFTGDYLAEQTEGSDASDPTYKYPLGINSVVDFSRKLADVLFGQVEDGPHPLVKTAVKAHTLSGEPAEEEDQTRAKFLQNLVNEVWRASNGRALQAENGIMSQFLGGCYFQVCWDPDDEDLLVPVRIKNHPPDCVLPLWNPNNPWELTECFIIYRLDVATARRQYGMNIPHDRQGLVIYVEHWTKDTYSVWLDGQPMRDPGDPDVVLRDAPNPFGFVPIVYIPRFREGNFYGSSIVDDIRGLVLELNARLADVGDALQEATHRELFVRNVQNPTSITLDDDGDVEAINLGNTRPLTNDQPDAFAVNPPVISESLAGNPETVRAYLLRAGNISTVAYGEDEGSQRSGVTLEIRLWPMLSITRLQRTFWEHGLNRIAFYIIAMCVVKNVIGELEQGMKITRKDLRRMLIHQDWATQVPRDKATFEQMLLNRLAQHGISLERFLELIGERDIEEEMQRILQDQKDLLELNAQYAGQETTTTGNTTGTSSSTKTVPIVPEDNPASEE